MKKLFALVLALVLLTSGAFTALAEKQATVPPVANSTQFPLVDEPTTITCLNWAYSYTRGDFEDQVFWSKLEEMTGIHIDFTTHYTDIEEKFALALTEVDLPDLFYKINLSKNDVWEYAQDDVFLPISDYLDYMPNFSYQLENMAGLKEALTMPDGKIYGFPYLITCGAALTLPIYVNGTWMEKLGIEEMPTTTDELKQLLIKVRDTDINGNGEADEIPLIATSLGGITAMLRGAWGIANRGSTAPGIDLDAEGNLRFYKAADEYREMLKYINELYTEGLLYSEIFTSDIPVLTAMGEQDRLFLAPCNIVDYFGETHKDEYVGVYTPFAGPDGTQMYTQASNPVGGMNTFISTDNPNPAATCAMIDWFYSDEGVRTYFMGWEGETYEYDENGNCVFTDFVTNNPEGLNTEEVLGSYVPWAGGRNPSMAEDKYFGNMYNLMSRDVAASLMKYGPEEIWPAFSYDEKDSERMAVLKNDIDTYVNECEAKFVTGEMNFEEDWDNYVKTLETIGLAELMEIYQRGLDTYKAVA